VSKFSPVAPQRFTQLEVTESQLQLHMRGVSGESVTVAFANTLSTPKVTSFTCVLPASGSVTLHVPDGDCIDH